MKLSTGLGLALSLVSFGCSGHSSKKNDAATPAPTTLTNPAQTSPADPTTGNTAPTDSTTVSTGSTGNNPVQPGGNPDQPVPLDPTSPVTNQPAPGTGPGNNPGTVTQPTQPTGPLLGLTGVWGISIAQKPRTCSSLYDLRDSKNLAIHILCPNDSGRSIAIQTETFQLTTIDAGSASFKRLKSTCDVPSQSFGMTVQYVVTGATGQRTLSLVESGHKSPVLNEVDAATLAGDLSSAATLYGKPVVRGCFKNGQLTTFVARKG